MELHKIEGLLHKYFEGQTSLEEEKALRLYFSSTRELPGELEAYRSLFGFYKTEHAQTYEKPVVSLRTKKTKKNWYAWAGVAASIAVVLVWSLTFNRSSEIIQTGENTSANYNLALENTQDLLLMMSSAFDNGKKQLSYINELNEVHNELLK